MAPWTLSRKLAWGSREVTGWNRPGQAAGGWGQSPARGRRWSVAGPENREKPNCAQLPPIVQSRLQPRAPGGRRHSLPSPGTGTNNGSGKENLPMLSLPEKGCSRPVSTARKLRRSSEGMGRAQPAAPCPEKQVEAGGRVKTQTVGSQDMSAEDCESGSTVDDAEFTNERIIDWLIGVNACLYRDPSLSCWQTLSNTEQDTSIKIVHQED